MRKITFVAVVVFLGLVGATVWTLDRENKRGIAYVTLSDLAPDNADRIELTGPQPNVLEKKGESWYLSGNGRLADIAQVRNLLKSSEHIRSADLLTRDPSRYAEYGVDNPNGTGVRIMGGGHELANIVAGRALTGGVAIRQGDAAYKVHGLFPNAFAHNANEWMERRLFVDANNDDVNRIEVALRGEPAYAIVRDGTGWALSMGRDHKPAPDFRLDAQAAVRLLQEVTHARAEVLLDHDPGAVITGLDKNVDRLTMEMKPKAAGDKPVRHTLVLGATGDNKSSYARVAGSKDVAVLPGYAVVQLRKSLESLRDLRLLGKVDLAHAKTMIIRRGRQYLTLVRQDGVWALPKGTGGHGGDIDQGLVARRAADIANARALALAPGVTPLQAGIAAREGEAKLILEDKSSMSLVFGRQAPGNQVYARGTADGKVYLVNAALRDHMLGMLDTLRAKPEGDPLARFDQEGIGNLPPDVRAGLSEHFAQKKREQQALQLMKGSKR